MYAITVHFFLRDIGTFLGKVKVGNKLGKM